MRSIFVADVGDGLTMGLRTLRGNTIGIDCGSQQGGEVPWRKLQDVIQPEAFMLSHFHTDHYKGLFHADLGDRGDRIEVRDVYFPRLPKCADGNVFMRCIVAMARRTMGDVTGSMEVDFLGVLRRVNSVGFKYRAVSAGDVICWDGSQLEVIWPPRELKDAVSTKAIADAINEFEAAMAADATLREIYQRVGVRGELEPYTSEAAATGEVGEGHGPVATDEVPVRVFNARQVPERTKKANRALRRAANHLCLAFHVDNRVLFLGDLDTQALGVVVPELRVKNRESFGVMVSPHHGTHWHPDLLSLRANSVVSSVGHRLLKGVRPGLKTIGTHHFVTHLQGDVCLGTDGFARSGVGLRDWW
jgi:hypothetical protein